MYVALERGRPRFTPDFSCLALLKNQCYRHTEFPTGLSPSVATCSKRLRMQYEEIVKDDSPSSLVLQPRFSNACQLDTETV